MEDTRFPARRHTRRLPPRAPGRRALTLRMVPVLAAPGSAARARALGGQGRRRRTGCQGAPRCPLPHTRAPRPASGRRPPRGRGGGAPAAGSPGPPPGVLSSGPFPARGLLFPRRGVPSFPGRFASLLLEFPPDYIGVERWCRPRGEPSSRSQRGLVD